MLALFSIIMATSKATSGSYRQYKNDTSIFMTWLSQAARVCGYSPPASSKVKTQQECDSRATTTRFGTPVKEILIQARTVVESAIPALVTPHVILKVAKRAIATRKQVTARFNALMANSEANDSHVYFTSVLEEAVELLNARYVVRNSFSLHSDLLRYDP